MSEAVGDVFFHCSLTSIGKTTHALGTAAAHVGYITRANSCRHILARGIPATLDRAKTYFGKKEGRTRLNARVCDGIVVALPKELTHEQHVEVVRTYCKRMTGGRAAYLAALHRPDMDGHPDNDHAHLVFDDTHPTTGLRVMRTTDADFAERARATWADVMNEAMEAAGLPGRADHRSYARRGIDREPGIHIGHAAMAAERKRLKGLPVPELASAPKEVRKSKGRKGESLDAPTRVVDYPAIDRGRSRSQANAEIAARNAARDRAAARAAARAASDRLRAATVRLGFDQAVPAGSTLDAAMRMAMQARAGVRPAADVAPPAPVGTPAAHPSRSAVIARNLAMQVAGRARPIEQAAAPAPVQAPVRAPVAAPTRGLTIARDLALRPARAPQDPLPAADVLPDPAARVEVLRRHEAAAAAREAAAADLGRQQAAAYEWNEGPEFRWRQLVAEEMPPPPARGPSVAPPRAAPAMGPAPARAADADLPPLPRTRDGDDVVYYVTREGVARPGGVPDVLSRIPEVAASRREEELFEERRPGAASRVWLRLTYSLTAFRAAVARIPGQLRALHGRLQTAAAESDEAYDVIVLPWQSVQAREAADAAAAEARAADAGAERARAAEAGAVREAAAARRGEEEGRRPPLPWTTSGDQVRYHVPEGDLDAPTGVRRLLEGTLGLTRSAEAEPVFTERPAGGRPRVWLRLAYGLTALRSAVDAVAGAPDQLRAVRDGLRRAADASDRAFDEVIVPGQVAERQVEAAAQPAAPRKPPKPPRIIDGRVLLQKSVPSKVQVAQVKNRRALDQAAARVKARAAAALPDAATAVPSAELAAREAEARAAEAAARIADAKARTAREAREAREGAARAAAAAAAAASVPVPVPMAVSVPAPVPAPVGVSVDVPVATPVASPKPAPAPPAVTAAVPAPAVAALPLPRTQAGDVIAFYVRTADLASPVSLLRVMRRLQVTPQRTEAGLALVRPSADGGDEHWWEYRFGRARLEAAVARVAADPERLKAALEGLGAVAAASDAAFEDAIVPGWRDLNARLKAAPAVRSHDGTVIGRNDLDTLQTQRAAAGWTGAGGPSAPATGEGKARRPGGLGGRGSRGDGGPDL